MMTSVMRLLCVVVCMVAGMVQGLDNGLALTPPMGWLAWERFRCNIDCQNDPDNCISENLFMTMADLMASEGYLDVGYDVVSLDDCWMAHERDSNGRLQPDPDRFPSGLNALSKHIHDKGLKFGIYEDYGNFTCGGYPGILGHLETDANTFADWEVDYVKLDGCYSKPEDMDTGYPEFGNLLNQTGRPMVYSCSWPAYQSDPNYTAIVPNCNLWRNYDDIEDSWDSVTDIIDHYADIQDQLQPLAGPGHWNDPDMLIVGDFGLSYDESKSQMAIWSILAAPLLMSVDLRTIKPEFKAILQNKAIIAVNQDPMGIQGTRVSKDHGIEVWTRPIMPLSESKDYSYAVAVLNRNVNGIPTMVDLSLNGIGLSATHGYNVTDLYDGHGYGHKVPSDNITLSVNPSGVVMLRCGAVDSGF